MTVKTALLALGLIAGLSMPVAAQDNSAPVPVPAPVIDNVYSFAVKDGIKTGAVFMTINATPNETSSEPLDKLVGAETPVAERVEIHMTVIEDDVMRMRPVDFLPLPPLGQLTLKPGGAHLMLMDMTQPLNVGETFPLTLHFERAGSVQLDVHVRAPGDSGEDASDHHDGHAH